MQTTVRNVKPKRLPYPKLVRHKGSGYIYYAHDKDNGVLLTGPKDNPLLFYNVKLSSDEDIYEDFQGVVTLKNDGVSAFGGKA